MRSALRGAPVAPRLLFSLLLVTLLAACGIPQSGTRPATAPEEPLDLSLVPPPETPAEAQRRPRSADVVHKTAAEARALFGAPARSEEHTSELQSLMRISYAVFCLQNKKK